MTFVLVSFSETEDGAREQVCEWKLALFKETGHEVYSCVVCLLLSVYLSGCLCGCLIIFFFHKQTRANMKLLGKIPISDTNVVCLKKRDWDILLHTLSRWKRAKTKGDKIRGDILIQTSSSPCFNTQWTTWILLFIHASTSFIFFTEVYHDNVLLKDCLVSLRSGVCLPGQSLFRSRDLSRTQRVPRIPMWTLPSRLQRWWVFMWT